MCLFGGSRAPFRTAGIAESLRLAATLPDFRLHKSQLALFSLYPKNFHCIDWL